MKEFWDQRYNNDAFVYGRQPNDFFREQIDLLPPGKILLPCEGEGRNAVYAALKGWEVTAFDQSSVGREKAMRLAAEHKVAFDYFVGDAEEFNTPLIFDCIAFLYAHFDPASRQRIHRRLAGHLSSKGILLLEGFSKAQIAFTSGGPRNPEMLFSADELREDFQGLSIKSLLEVRVNIEEGDFHRGEARLVRLIAHKA